MLDLKIARLFALPPSPLRGLLALAICSPSTQSFSSSFNIHQMSVDLHSLPAGSRPDAAIRNNGPDHLVLERLKLRELAEGWPCYRHVVTDALAKS